MIILGGDGEDAVRSFFDARGEVADDYLFVFTSGGAALTFLAGKALTVLDYIDTINEP